MSATSKVEHDPWPALAYQDFAATRHLLHMGLQVMGKLKLTEAFQPQWSEVPLWLSARGLTTGPIPLAGGAYEVTADFIAHEVGVSTSWGFSGDFGWAPMSVAEFADRLFDLLREGGVDVSINMLPQEVPDPVSFDEDKQPRQYEPALVNRWWRILLSVQRVMQACRGRFKGKMQPVGVMWGTLDIRDLRYNGKPVVPGPENANYIRRNCMNEGLIEMGWWAGDSAYSRPAFYSFTYPQPKGIERAQVSPTGARWDASMGEFLLDYDDLRNSKDADRDLLSFFESTCRAGAERAGWDPGLVGSGTPV